RLFPKHSLWDSNVLWAALAALVLATSSMAVVGFTLLARPSSSSLGVHFACVAPPGDKTTAYLDTFQDSHAIVGALVQLATFSVLGLVSLYVGIQCSFSQQKVMSNPHNSNLSTSDVSAFVLPCYGTIWYTVAVLSVTEIAVIASSQVEYVEAHRRPFCIVLNLPSMWIRHLIPLMMLQKSVSQRAVHRAIALFGILTAAVLSVLVEPDTFPIVFIVYPIAVMLLSAFVKFVLHTRASFDLYFYFLLVSCVANILLCVVPPSVCLVFEFCDLGSLESILQSQRRSGEGWDLRVKLKACVDACRAVAYLHSFQPPLLHRYDKQELVFIKDIKTANYLLSSTDGLLKLSDFGESNLLGPKNDGTMTVVGTVDFMAPEMIIGGNTKSAVYGPAADVYSLTVTLWHILVPGEAPWRGQSHFDVYTEIIQGQRPRLPPDLPPGCIELLESGWCPQPHDRQPIDVMVQRVLELYRPFAQQDTAPRQVNRSASKRRSSVLASSFLSKQNTTPPESE
ncbi:hypothetical protein AaE_003870, partial [Aphanomyces astaci]